ncbi:hypothetical protein TNCV_5020501 [Trichonephila clavipes]|nr:hypothetical protein TNCV_5020501 [Trichonephila clavipes]
MISISEHLEICEEAKSEKLHKTKIVLWISHSESTEILMAIYVSGGSEETTRHQFAFDISIRALHLVCDVVVLYRRGLTNALYQQDNARPHVACRVLIFLYTQGIRLLPWYTLPFSPDNMVDEMWHRHEAAWNELPISVIQAQLDSMHNRVMAI